MNNYLRDIHNIFVAKDVFEKTFYIARKSGICECKVIEIGLCIAGDNREHGYVKLLIAGEDEPFVTSNTLGYAAFPALDKIYGSWMDCVKGVDSCKVFDVVSGTCIGDGIFYDVSRILVKDGYTVARACVGTDRIQCFAVNSETHLVVSKDATYSMMLDKDGLHFDVVPGEGYYSTVDEAIRACQPPIIRFKGA